MTDSSEPTQYLKRLRSRDNELNTYIGTNCTHVEMVGFTGKTRKVISLQNSDNKELLLVKDKRPQIK